MIRVSDRRIISKQDWRSLIEQLGLFEKLQNAKKIVIKPNLAAGTHADPHKHICTDMGFMKNIVELCHDCNPNAEILICEGDSTGDGFAYLKFEHFQLPNIVDPEGKMGIKVLDLSRDRLKLIEDRRFLYFQNGQKLWLSETLSNADFLISLSNLKTHSVTLYTGACKNLFGCLPSTVKSVYHPYIHEVVHDLTLALKPDLSIVDAFYAMEKNGPVSGLDIDGGTRIFGNNAYEADCYGSAFIGIESRQVGYLKLLKKDFPQIAIDSEIVRKNSFCAVKPETLLRVNNSIGLWIQRRGAGLSGIGDRIHIARTPFRFMIAIFRPLLVKLIGITKLKALRNYKERE